MLNVRTRRITARPCQTWNWPVVLFIFLLGVGCFLAFDRADQRRAVEDFYNRQAAAQLASQYRDYRTDKSRMPQPCIHGLLSSACP
jgi:hypothetical protein